MIKKHLRRLRSETMFLLEHKWSLVKPADAFAISKSVLKKYLPENPVIVDCGAHIGTDSLQLARLFPAGFVHCFEPIPAIFSQLVANTNNRENISCYNQALGIENGVSTMYVSSGASDGSSSLLLPSGHLESHPDVHFNEQIEVKTSTLDTWANENQIGHVDFLWLDMQGFEYDMLNVSTIVLPTVKVIYTEVSIRETYENAMPYKQFDMWLRDQGFQLVKEMIPHDADMGNALYARSESN